MVDFDFTIPRTSMKSDALSLSGSRNVTLIRALSVVVISVLIPSEVFCKFLYSIYSKQIIIYILIYICKKQIMHYFNLLMIELLFQYEIFKNEMKN